MDLLVIGTIVLVFLVLLVASLLVNRMPAKTFEEMQAEKKRLADQMKQTGRKQKGTGHASAAGNLGATNNASATTTTSSASHRANQNNSKKNKPAVTKQSREVAHVEFVAQEVIPVESIPIAVAVKNASKAIKQKGAAGRPVEGILVNKSDPVLVAESQIENINHFDVLHPKDDVEMLRTVAKEDTRKSANNKVAVDKKKKEKVKGDKIAKVAAAKEDDLDQLMKLSANKLAATGAAAAGGGDGKRGANKGAIKGMSNEADMIKRLVEGADDSLSASFIITLLSKAELSRPEIQLVIDYLLNKQSDSITLIDSEWTEGKQDLVQRLKKQLAEREEQLSNEKEASLSFQNKLRELRQELNVERSQAGSTVKAYALKMAEKEHHISQLTADLAQAATDKAALLANFQAKLMHDKNSSVNLNKQIEHLTEVKAKLQMEMDHYKTYMADQQLQQVQSMRDMESMGKEQELFISKLNEKLLGEERKLMEVEQKVAEAQKNEEHARVELRNRENALVSVHADLTHSRAEAMQLRKKVDEVNEQLMRDHQNFKQVRDDLNSQVAESSVKVTNYTNLLADKEAVIAAQKEQLSDSQKAEENLKQQLEEYKEKNNDNTANASQLAEQKSSELRTKLVKLMSQHNVFSNINMDKDRLNNGKSQTSSTTNNHSSSNISSNNKSGDDEGEWMEKMVTELKGAFDDYENQLSHLRQQLATSNNNSSTSNNNSSNSNNHHNSNKHTNNGDDSCYAKGATNGNSAAEAGSNAKVGVVGAENNDIDEDGDGQRHQSIEPANRDEHSNGETQSATAAAAAVV